MMMQARDAPTPLNTNMEKKEQKENSLSGLPSPVITDFDFKRFVKLLEDMPTTASPQQNTKSLKSPSKQEMSPTCNVDHRSSTVPLVTLSDAENDSEPKARSFKSSNKSLKPFNRTYQSRPADVNDIAMKVSTTDSDSSVSNLEQLHVLKRRIKILESQRAEDSITFANAKAAWSQQMEELQHNLSDSLTALQEMANTLNYVMSTAVTPNGRPMQAHLGEFAPHIQRFCAAVQQQAGRPISSQQMISWIPNKSMPADRTCLELNESPFLFTNRTEAQYQNEPLVYASQLRVHDGHKVVYPQLPLHVGNSTFTAAQHQDLFDFRSNKRRNICEQQMATSLNPVPQIPPTIHPITPVEGKWGTTDGQEGDLKASDAPGLVRVLFVQWNGMTKHARKTIGEAELYLQSASQHLDSNNIIFHCFSRPPGTRGLRARVPMGAMWDSVFVGSPLLARFKYSSRVFTDTCNAKDLRKSSRPSRMHGFHENIFTAHQAVRDACTKDSETGNLCLQH